MFYDKFIELCKQKGTKPTPLVLQLGLSSSNVSQWKKGSTPRPEVLKKLADYFDVSVGYLVGESEQKEKPTVKDDGLDGKALDMLLERMTIAELQELMGKTAAAMAKRAQNG